ncbi:hypothetical protein SDC9_167087 [bioreactor metagenome]|uniref:Uncharacterized protein n=1 Tax=bioreactor metagenome TaxID=1076179 RepID=A0A645FZ98_9ZZZZ
MGYHGDEADDDDQEDEQFPDRQCADKELLTNADKGLGYARNDGCKDQHRNAVTNTLLRDALAEPHQERRTRRRANADGGIGKPVCVYQILRAEADEDTDGLNHGQHNAGIAGDLFDLDLAILFLAQALQRRNRDCEQLEDNRRVDVG